MSRRASVRRLLLAVVMAIIALFGAGRPAAANRVAAVVPGGIYTYDVPAIARVAVHGVPPVEVSQRQVSGVRQGFASPAAQAPGTSTTFLSRNNATDTVPVAVFVVIWNVRRRWKSHGRKKMVAAESIDPRS